VTRVEVTNGVEDDRLLLFDDGTHGDAVAGDRTFTRSEVTLRCSLCPAVRPGGRSMAGHAQGRPEQWPDGGQ
jgi:hypothetical protein